MDITETSISPRPLDQPTEMSQSIFRARTHQIFNKLYVDDGARIMSYDYVRQIDDEILALLDGLPWYVRINHDADGNGPDNTSLGCMSLPQDSALECVAWQFHILHTCICAQRMRMYRPFLHPRIGEALPNCLSAAESAFLVYRRMLRAHPPSPRFLAQAYQIFLVGVALAAFLIVERGAIAGDRLRRDIEMAVEDLQVLDTKDTSVDLATDGRKILRRMLAIYDRRGDGGTLLRPEEEPEALAQGISSVFGGESQARSYLSRFKIRQLLTSGDLERRTESLDSHPMPWPSTPAQGVAVAAPGAPSLPPLPHHSVPAQISDYHDTETDGLQGFDLAEAYDFDFVDSIVPPDVFNWWPIATSWEEVP
jgi:hypothetical protein